MPRLYAELKAEHDRGRDHDLRWRDARFTPEDAARAWLLSRPSYAALPPADFEALVSELIPVHVARRQADYRRVRVPGRQPRSLTHNALLVAALELVSERGCPRGQESQGAFALLGDDVTPRMFTLARQKLEASASDISGPIPASLATPSDVARARVNDMKAAILSARRQQATAANATAHALKAKYYSPDHVDREPIRTMVKQ